LLDAGAKADDSPTSTQPRTADVAAGFRTPLMWAAYRNDVRMVRLLLEHGADPNQSTKRFDSGVPSGWWTGSTATWCCDGPEAGAAAAALAPAAGEDGT